VGLKTFSRLFQAVGTVGLTGLDRLYSFMNVRELQRFTDLYRRVLKAEKGMHQFLAAFAAELEPVTSMPHNAAKMYAAAVGKASKFFPIFNGAAGPEWVAWDAGTTAHEGPNGVGAAELAHVEHVSKLGHHQLVRRMIGNELTVRFSGTARRGVARPSAGSCGLFTPGGESQSGCPVPEQARLVHSQQHDHGAEQQPHHRHPELLPGVRRSLSGQPKPRGPCLTTCL